MARIARIAAESSNALIAFNAGFSKIFFMINKHYIFTALTKIRQIAKKAKYLHQTAHFHKIH